MTFPNRSPIPVALIAALSATFAQHAAAAPLDAPAAQKLATLHAAPESAGSLVYRGTVRAAKAPQSAPLFSYERRLLPLDEGAVASHITRDASGATIIAEQAQFDAGYALRRFEAVNAQLGYSGSVDVSADGTRLAYRLIRDGQASTAAETVSDPVVSGPSLHGFVLRHWDTLAAGKRIPVRMIVLAGKTTYGFDIRQAAQADGRTSFSITPSNLLVRLAIAPLTVTFDNATRSVVRYDGRVPPMQHVDGKLANLDARVDYTMQARTYR